MKDLAQEIRFAFRTLGKSPGFTFVVVLTLALGIGANTAIFGLIDQLLVRALPVRDPERLVVLDAPGPFSGSTENNYDALTPVSHPMFEGIRDRCRVFEGVLAFYSTGVHVSARDTPERVRADLVSGTFFETLGVEPSLGRLFTPEDDVRPGGHPLVVLGHGFWERRFASDPKAVGRSLVVNGHPMTVIGVAERGFHGVEVGDSVDLYLPLMMQAQLLPTRRPAIGNFRSRWLTAMARLRGGVSPEEARAEVNVVYRQLLQEDLQTINNTETFRERFASKEIQMLPGGRGISGLRYQSQTPLLVLMGMVGVVLLIACANVANLLLARSSVRRREIALRVALGASRARLVRQLLLESVLLALAGGLVGTILAIWTGDALLRSLPYENASRVFEAEPDLRVAFFTFLVSLATGLAFGAIPALSATRPEVAPTLKNEAGTLVSRASGRFRSGLVVAQVALSLLLLIGAGLFVKSLSNLGAIDPGFEPDGILTFAVNPALNGYELERRMEMIARIREEASAVPGVRSVSVGEVPLMTNSRSSSTVKVEGYESKEDENMNPGLNGVAPEFFSTLGIPFLAGRDFTAGDDLASPRVAVVNESFARYFYGGGDPVGRRFFFGRDKDTPITIIGFVGDGKSMSLREEPERFLYLPYTQTTDLGGVTFYVRSAVDPESLGARLREAVARVDSSLPVTDMKTMNRQIDESLYVERMVAALSVAFGGLATLLAAVGLYGVLSYTVAARTREIGIRVALGAERKRLLLLVLREVAVLSLLGIGIGLPAGFFAGRLVEGQLYGLSGRDPFAIVLATFVLLATAAIAGYIPAARASRVDPMVALRYE